MMLNLNEDVHKRFNLLTGDWVLVSPHRMKRPWQGKQENVHVGKGIMYDETCYLCPENKRADGSKNPAYTKAYSFVNDYSALLQNGKSDSYNNDDLLVAKGETGICKVICFSPRHDLTLPLLSLDSIIGIVELWQKEFNDLSVNSQIKYIQIFENKGEIMGCSNPHPHGQIWASSEIPLEINKESFRQKQYWEKNKRSLLADYLNKELELNERIVLENEFFVALVPFWAVWPFETMIICKEHRQNISQFSDAEKIALAEILKELTIKYDNLFNVSFPYSAGMHQNPVNNGEYPEWHWHMHFYPPLLRSATVKKFMVGYEMLANPQRDITAEKAAEQLRLCSSTHYSVELQNKDTTQL